MARSPERDNAAARPTPALPSRHGPAQARDYLDIAGVVIVALDAAGHITLINRLGCQLLGHSEAELVGQDWFSVCVPESERPMVRQGFERIMAGELQPLREYENRVLLASGDTRIMSWRNTLLRDGLGRPVGTLSSGEDITERRRMEQELARYRATLEERIVQRTAALRDANRLLETEIEQRRTAEAQLRRSVDDLRHAQSAARALLDAPLDMCALLDGEGTILDVNEAATELLGLPREAVVGRVLYDVFRDAHATEVRRHAHEALRMGAPVQYEAQGDDGVYGVQVYPIPGEGGQDRVAVYVRDISRQHASERAQQLAEARLRALVEALPQPAALLEGREARVVTCSSGFRHLIGPTPGPGSPPSPSDAPQIALLEPTAAALFDSATGEPPPPPQAVELRRRDGSALAVTARVFSLPAEGPHVWWALLVEQDPPETRE